MDLLVVTAHPDDEALYCGGLINKAASAGRQVALATLTRGGIGRTLDMCRPEALAGVRQGELRSAAEALGVACLEIFDLPDGALAEHSPIGVRILSDCLQRLNPRVLVTFPPNGMTGHHDHVAVHRIVREVLRRSRCYRTAVYYFASDSPFVEPPRPGFLPPAEVNRLQLAPTCRIDVSSVVTQKLTAMACHETQARSVVKFLRLYPDRILTESYSSALEDNDVRLEELVT
jgi:LmbE family N-acetylglucosaminyl deacetylase